MRLNPRPPFDFDLTATHMYVLPPATYSDGTFRRVLRLKSGRLVCVSITAEGSVDDPQLLVSEKPRVSDDDARDIKERVSFMFSTDDDLAKFYSIGKKDPVLKQVIEDLYGLKIQTTPSAFEGLVIAFCLHWVSFQRGVKMLDCLTRRYGEQANGYHAFPTPEALADATLEELRECKLGFRAERIQWISERVAQGLDLEALRSLPDDQLREELLKIKWVGKVTAEASLLWRFRRCSAFPLDAWSSKILRAFYPELKEKALDQIRSFAEDRWGDQKGLAYYYLMCGRKKLARRLNLELGEKQRN